jgi:hypothetical protein
MRQPMKWTWLTLSLLYPQPVVAEELRSHTFGWVVLPAVPVHDSITRLENRESQSSTASMHRSRLLDMYTSRMTESSL